MSREEIQRIAVEKKIPFLVHFTRSENVKSIMEHGLLPVAKARENGLAPVINDEERLDGRLNGTSLSLSFPNGNLFYKFRNKDEQVQWVILAVATSVLWSKSVLFCKHNAADKRISSVQSHDLSTPDAFLSMFEEIEGCEPRADQGIRPFDPTDVQAEVLAMESIEPEFIVGALVNSVEQQGLIQPILGRRKIIVHHGRKGFFANRSYYRKFGGG